MTPEETLARQIALPVALATTAGSGNDMAEAIRLSEAAISKAIKKAILASHRERCQDEGHQFMQTKCMWCGEKRP